MIQLLMLWTLLEYEPHGMEINKMQLYLIKMNDGKVKIMHLIKGDVSQSISRLPDAADVISFNEILETDLPPDREFREAWTHNGNQIDFDLGKAKAIQLSRIRMVRDKILSDLDRDYLIALETQDDSAMSIIALEKQRLRNITEPLKQLIPNSIDDIKNAYPADLEQDVT